MELFWGPLSKEVKGCGYGHNRDHVSSGIGRNGGERPSAEVGRRLDEDTLSRIERRCAQVAFPPLLAGAIWFLFTFYPMIRLIVLIIEALGAILLVILGVILLKFYLYPNSGFKH
jgi:hypothetical protein